MKHSSNVQEMIEHFMEYHNRRYSISDIAKHFGVSVKTIYWCLGEIALANGVSRESLLDQPRENVMTECNIIRRDDIDLNGLAENFSCLEREFCDVIGKFEQLAKE